MLPKCGESWGLYFASAVLWFHRSPETKKRWFCAALVTDQGGCCLSLYEDSSAMTVGKMKGFQK